EETRNGRVRISRFQQLDQRIGGLDEGNLQLAVRQLSAVDQVQPQLVAVEVHRVVDAGYGNADVVNRQRRLLHRSKYLRSARSCASAPNKRASLTRSQRPNGDIF